MGGQLSFPNVNLTGKTVIVTGANTGIGFETAKALAAMGATVTVACRNEEKGNAAIQRLREQLPDKNLSLEFAKLDLASLSQVQEFAKNFLANHDYLHLLINNAGVAMPSIAKTSDGFGTQYQVNYLGHLLLTLLLMPILEKTRAIAQSQGTEAAGEAAAKADSQSASASAGDASPLPPSKEVRVIFVSSKGHSVYKFSLDRNVIAGEGDKFNVYCISKLYQVQLAISLQRHFNRPGLVFHAVHPGTVKTEISRDLSGFWKHMTSAMNATGQLLSPEKGAYCTLNAAVNPEFDGLPSTYFDSCKPKSAAPAALNETFQSQVWNVSLGHIQSILTEANIPELNINWQDVEDAKSDSTTPPPLESSSAQAPSESAADAAAASSMPEERQEAQDPAEDGEPRQAEPLAAASPEGQSSESKPGAGTTIENDCLILPGEATDGIPVTADTLEIPVD